MNRRGFLKCALLSPLAVLLKPKKQTIAEYDAEAIQTIDQWAEKHRITDNIELNEYQKYMRDVVCYGTGGMMVTKTGKMQHVPIDKIFTTKQPVLTTRLQSNKAECYGKSPLKRT